MFALLVLWMCVSVPLCFAGSFFGFRKDAISVPVRTNPLPRHIPPQPWYLTTLPSVLIGGILPFGAVFIELFFVMSSIWLHQVCAVCCPPPPRTPTHAHAHTPPVLTILLGTPRNDRRPTCCLAS